ncbi:MAG: hypothetical protein GY953_20710 [bacterium]|nr:hypothetical protein [bacterium]
MDRFERGMEHLLKSQAEQETGLDCLRESEAAHHRWRTDFAKDLQQLLTARVLLQDAQQKSEEKLTKLDEETDRRLRQLTAAQQHTGDRLNALIKVVDGTVHDRPQ